MWSGPRNLSTALMRSFENREDTVVWDEPLYAYYLNETKKNHPLNKEIISIYETKNQKLIADISKKNTDGKIYYQKHMTHHILDKTPLDWIKNGTNCFLIRNPRDVLLSYIKKNELNNSDDLGFPMQIKLFKILKSFNLKTIVINAEDIAKNPKKMLSILCKKLNISFSEKMLRWPSGKRPTDGLWGDVWYKNVNSSICFEKMKKDKSDIPKIHEETYKECIKIYEELNKYNILNE